MSTSDTETKLSRKFRSFSHSDTETRNLDNRGINSFFLEDKSHTSDIEGDFNKRKTIIIGQDLLKVMHF